MASRPRLVAKFPSAHNAWEISHTARRGGVGTSRSPLMFAPARSNAKRPSPYLAAVVIFWI
jgi:hypothetical protein